MKHALNAFRKRRDRYGYVRNFLFQSFMPDFRMKGYLAGSVLLLLLLCMGSCSDDNSDYYDKPAWLEDPVYDVLQQKGSFTLYLQAVDRTLYAQVLRGSGNYTVFAPTDDAFKDFLTDKGYSSVEAIPVDELNKIIGSSLVYNRFESTRLGDALVDKEWVEGTSIRKRTSYYKTIYKEMVKGKEEWVFDWDGQGRNTTIYTPYKSVPVFTNSYFAGNSLSGEDYTIFYPGSSFVGTNMAGAKVVEADIYAENGVIHSVSSVPYPIENLDEYLQEDKFSAFKNILYYEVNDFPVFVTYYENTFFTEEYKKIYPELNISTVYMKSFDGEGNLPFYPNNEYYSNSDLGLTFEQGGNTMIVPSNGAVTKFVNEKLLKYASSLSELSIDVVASFVKAHMVSKLVWPSDYSTSQNANGEFLNGEGNRGPSFNQSPITESRMASNGILYYSEEVIKSKYFETVYSEVLLNPACNLLNIAYNKFYTGIVDDLMKSPLTGFTDERFTLIIPTDDLFAEDGYSYNAGDATFSNPDLLGSLAVDDRLRRLIRMGIFYRDQNTDLKDFTGGTLPEYEGYGYAVNSYGEMIRYRNNELQAIGNIKSNEVVNIEYVGELNNGHVFKMDKLLQYSPRTTNPTEASGWEDQSLYDCLKEYVESNSNSSLFFEYLTKTLYNATDGTIAGINASGLYSVLIPQNDTLQELIDRGVFPEPDSSLLNIASTDYNAEIAESVADFISIHFLGGTILPDDGLNVIMPGNYSSLILSTAYRVTDLDLDLISEKTDVIVSKENGKLIFTPRNIESGGKVLVQGVGEATVIRDINKSNYMGSRVVIHAIDSYLSFKVNSPNNQ